MSTVDACPLTPTIGNDPELDPERATPQPPTQAIDKPLARTGKRNAPAEAPVRAAGSAPGTSQRDNKSSHEKSTSSHHFHSRSSN